MGSSSRSAADGDRASRSRPFHKGDGHVTDDTLMTRVLVRAYARSATTSTPTTSTAPRPADRRREDLDPRARGARPCSTTGSSSPRSGSCPSPTTATPTRGRPASATSSTAAPRCTWRRSASRTPATRPGLRRGDRAHGRPPVELRPRGRGRVRRRRRRGDAAWRRRSRAWSRSALDLAKDGTRTAIEAVHRRGGGARRLARRGLAVLRRRVRPVRLRRRALPRARAERARSRAGCTRSRSSRSHSACSWRPAATAPRPCSAGSTTAATPTRSRRWAARSPARSAAAPRSRASGSSEVSAASRIDVEEAGREMAAIAVEIFERDVRRARAARPRGRGTDRRRSACVRVTWVQPEDLVGHELRQAARGGQGRRRDRGPVARRGRCACPAARRLP